VAPQDAIRARPPHTGVPEIGGQAQIASCSTGFAGNTAPLRPSSYPVWTCMQHSACASTPSSAVAGMGGRRFRVLPY